jgi:hypothetical protein
MTPTFHLLKAKVLLFEKLSTRTVTQVILLEKTGPRTSVAPSIKAEVPAQS